MNEIILFQTNITQVIDHYCSAVISTCILCSYSYQKICLLCIINPFDMRFRLRFVIPKKCGRLLYSKTIVGAAMDAVESRSGAAARDDGSMPVPAIIVRHGNPIVAYGRSEDRPFFPFQTSMSPTSIRWWPTAGRRRTTCSDPLMSWYQVIARW